MDPDLPPDPLQRLPIGLPASMVVEAIRRKTQRSHSIDALSALTGRFRC
jgi:hypothetical protein